METRKQGPHHERENGIPRVMGMGNSRAMAVQQAQGRTHPKGSKMMEDCWKDAPKKKVKML